MKALVLNPRLISSWKKVYYLRAFSCSKSSSSINYSNQSRGGLPRFFSETLPSSKGDVVRVQGDEFWHMTKVMRLNVNDRIELFNGKGGLVEGCIQKIDRAGLDLMAMEFPRTLLPWGMQWHVYAAFGSLKGGRADWLLEKCTELGASSVTPLLTERSASISDNRIERLERVILAAEKQWVRLHTSDPPPQRATALASIEALGLGRVVIVQSCFTLGVRPQGQRLHGMTLKPPIPINDLLPTVAQSEVSFLAAAEATPIFRAVGSLTVKPSGLLIIGPEGDFTREESDIIGEAGAISVGLGPHRLRVETATVALLATVMLWSDSQVMPNN